MELRHLRYFLAVGEALNFTKAAARLRVAQPALSRQVQDLEDEIGVNLLRRSPRGGTLTAEGKLFLEEVRQLLKHADESGERVRGLARGEYGELHIGYIPIPTVEILPPAIEAFRKFAPQVKLVATMTYQVSRMRANGSRISEARDTGSSTPSRTHTSTAAPFPWAWERFWAADRASTR